MHGPDIKVYTRGISVMEMIFTDLTLYSKKFKGLVQEEHYLYKTSCLTKFESRRPQIVHGPCHGSRNVKTKSVVETVHVS